MLFFIHFYSPTHKIHFFLKKISKTFFFQFEKSRVEKNLLTIFLVAKKAQGCQQIFFHSAYFQIKRKSLNAKEEATTRHCGPGTFISITLICFIVHRKHISNFPTHTTQHTHVHTHISKSLILIYIINHLPRGLQLDMNSYWWLSFPSYQMSQC